MSSRLVTTPWFTKNLAGGCMDRAPPPGHAGREGRRMVARGEGRGGFDSGARSAAPAGIKRACREDPAMLLAVDVGNTNVTIGSFRNGSLVAVRRAFDPQGPARPTSSSCSSRACFRLDDVRVRGRVGGRGGLGGPGGERPLEAVTARRDRPLLLAGAGTVPPPSGSTGRATSVPIASVNAFAASRLHGTPAIVVDLGTATTFDCVAHDGAFVGGVIAPGVEAGLAALLRDRPPAAGRAADAGAGDQATRARRSRAARSSATSRWSRACSRVRRELADAADLSPQDVHVVLTGGLSKAPFAGDRGHRGDRSGPHAEGPRGPARRGRWRDAARAPAGVIGSPNPGRSAASSARRCRAPKASARRRA